LQNSWSTCCLSLGEFLANLCLLNEVFHFLPQVPSAPSIRSRLNDRVIAGLAIADSVRDLVLVLCGPLAQGLGLAQQLARSLAESLTQEASMATPSFGHL
jgi:hypothetical protein